MAVVFRVEKNKGYTVMSNHHLRNAELTLKAKGLLSQMLSLPENWDYTLKGLSHINRESIDAIRTAVWELERAGYITRKQGRDEKGKMTPIEYSIFEQPQNKPAAEQENCPVLENPTAAKKPENPVLENPIPDN
ncbi:MAG TPA: helix-turn-helix domain-containing protein, partial [Clostridia bacterium]|nr:helix-turn-helix domain-containing protein [Clostridia bacterium]